MPLATLVARARLATTSPTTAPSNADTAGSAADASIPKWRRQQDRKDSNTRSLNQWGLTDCLGQFHEFHFRCHLFGTGVAIDAFELRNGDPAGYFFQIIGEPEVDLLVLLGRLVEKMRRALSIKHLKDGDYGLQIADSGVVRGRIESDDADDGQLPLLVIDGREIHWNQFGRTLISHERTPFKLTIADKSEEL